MNKDISSVSNLLFETLGKLEERTITPERARTIGTISQTLIDSLRLEMELKKFNSELSPSDRTPMTLSETKIKESLLEIENARTIKSEHRNKSYKFDN